MQCGGVQRRPTRSQAPRCARRTLPGVTTHCRRSFLEGTRRGRTPACPGCTVARRSRRACVDARTPCTRDAELSRTAWDAAGVAWSCAGVAGVAAAAVAAAEAAAGGLRSCRTPPRTSLSHTRSGHSRRVRCRRVCKGWKRTRRYLRRTTHPRPKHLCVRVQIGGSLARLVHADDSAAPTTALRQQEGCANEGPLPTRGLCPAGERTWSAELRPPSHAFEELVAKPAGAWGGMAISAQHQLGHSPMEEHAMAQATQCGRAGGPRTPSGICT